jgi:hypothetical protein
MSRRFSNIVTAIVALASIAVCAGGSLAAEYIYTYTGSLDRKDIGSNCQLNSGIPASERYLHGSIVFREPLAPNLSNVEVKPNDFWFFDGVQHLHTPNDPIITPETVEDFGIIVTTNSTGSITAWTFGSHYCSHPNRLGCNGSSGENVTRSSNVGPPYDTFANLNLDGNGYCRTSTDKPGSWSGPSSGKPWHTLMQTSCCIHDDTAYTKFVNSYTTKEECLADASKLSESYCGQPQYCQALVLCVNVDEGARDAR